MTLITVFKSALWNPRFPSQIISHCVASVPLCRPSGQSIMSSMEADEVGTLRSALAAALERAAAFEAEARRAQDALEESERARSELCEELREARASAKADRARHAAAMQQERKWNRGCINEEHRD